MHHAVPEWKTAASCVKVRSLSKKPLPYDPKHNLNNLKQLSALIGLVQKRPQSSFSCSVVTVPGLLPPKACVSLCVYFPFLFAGPG